MPCNRHACAKPQACHPTRKPNCHQFFNRMLEALADEIREKIGFKVPEQSKGSK